jgi:hypothetical protein
MGHYLISGADGYERSSILTYPRLFWIDHARQAETSINLNGYLSTKLLRWSHGSHIEWFDFHWNAHHADWDKQPENFTPLHFAAYGGIGNLAKALVAHGYPINEILLMRQRYTMESSVS